MPKIKQRKLSIHTYFYIVILSIIILCLGINCLLLPSQVITTVTDHNLTSGMPLKFSDLDYCLNDITINFPSGGYILPIYRNQQLIGSALFGSGSIKYKDSVKTINECYLLINKTTYSQLLSKLYLQTSEVTTFKERSLHFAETAQKYEQAIFTPSGFKFLTLPDNYLQCVIFEENSTTFKPTESYPSDSRNPFLTKPVMLISMGYFLIYLSLIGILIILSSKFCYSHRRSRFYLPKQSLLDYKWHFLIIISGWLVLRYAFNNIYITALFQIATIIYLFFIAVKQRKIPLNYIRSEIATNVRNIPFGLLVGLLFFLCAHPVLPHKINSIIPWLQFSILHIWIPVAWVIVVVYGFIFYELERLLPVHIAISSLIIGLSLITSVIFALFYHMGTFMLVFNTLLYQPLLFLLLIILTLYTESLSTGIIALALSLSLPFLFI